MMLQDVNQKYYCLYSELYRSRTVLPEKQYATMSKVLMHNYEQDVQDYLDDQLLQFGMQRFERKFKIKHYTPRRRLFFWWNPVAKKLLKQYVAEFKTYLAELEKNTREEKEYAAELNKGPETTQEAAHPLEDGQCTALTTPSETGIAEQESPFPTS